MRYRGGISCASGMIYRLVAVTFNSFLVTNVLLFAIELCHCYQDDIDSDFPSPSV